MDNTNTSLARISPPEKIPFGTLAEFFDRYLKQRLSQKTERVAEPKSRHPHRHCVFG